MLAILAGLGLVFTIALTMTSVYVVVAIIEFSQDDKLTGKEVAIAITQVVCLLAVGFVVLSLIGWLLIQPLMPALVHCG